MVLNRIIMLILDLLKKIFIQANYFLLFDLKQLLKLKLVTIFLIPSLVNYYRDHNTGFMK
jgi:hypothetical protein